MRQYIFDFMHIFYYLKKTNFQFTIHVNCRRDFKRHSLHLNAGAVRSRGGFAPIAERSNVIYARDAIFSERIF